MISLLSFRRRSPGWRLLCLTLVDRFPAPRMKSTIAEHSSAAAARLWRKSTGGWKTGHNMSVQCLRLSRLGKQSWALPICISPVRAVLKVLAVRIAVVNIFIVSDSAETHNSWASPSTSFFYFLSADNFQSLARFLYDHFYMVTCPIQCSVLHGACRQAKRLSEEWMDGQNAHA